MPFLLLFFHNCMINQPITISLENAKWRRIYTTSFQSHSHTGVITTTIFGLLGIRPRTISPRGSTWVGQLGMGQANTRLTHQSYISQHGFSHGPHVNLGYLQLIWAHDGSDHFWTSHLGWLLLLQTPDLFSKDFWNPKNQKFSCMEQKDLVPLHDKRLY